MSLLDFSALQPIANAVARHGIKTLVETGAGSDATGCEVAMRLGLHAHVHTQDGDGARALASRYPLFDVYDGYALDALRAIVPTIQGAALFLLDDTSPTHFEEVALIEAESGDQEWHMIAKGGQAAASPASADLANAFDRSEEFDRNWVGPPEAKPLCYRTQSEKDTWYAVAVENEYRLPALMASDVVVDIGAHIGSFSWLAHRSGSRNVHAFEIDPWHLQAASQNLGSCDGVTLYSAAVVRGDEARKPAYFYDGKWNAFADAGEPVDDVSLDKIIDRVGDIRFLKIDCEGGEWGILYTCKQLARVQEIAGEYHEGAGALDGLPAANIGALAMFAVANGFTYVAYTASVPGIGNFWFKRI